MSKYHAQRTKVLGISFASKAEARRYSELLMLAKAGQITALVLQPKYPLHVKEWKIGNYIADFSYINIEGKQIVEEIKGFKTAIFKWKLKHVEAEYGINITVIHA